MCSSCVTVFDAVSTNAVFVAAIAVNRWDRLRDRLERRPRLERDLATWEANAAFVAGLGLDPLAVLGAPPALPVDDLERVTVQ